MTTDILGLPDADIDRLLAEAESRLANHGGSEKGVVVASGAPAAKAVTATASPLPPSAGDPTAVSKQKPEKLSVRVPQLAQKKKAPKDNLGSDWYHLPKTDLTPELKNDLKILKLRDVVAMGKQFFKKDTRKNFVPEYCQVGTIIAGATDGANNRLTRKERKQTIVEEVLAGEKTENGLFHLGALNVSLSRFAKMNTPPIIRPLQSILRGRLTATPETSSGASKTKKQAKPKKAASAAPKATAKASATAKDKKGDIALPRSLELLYMDAPKRKAKYGVPTCDLQLRSYSVRNLEFFCDFALRAAYYLGLPASGPVPLPRLRELWTVPKSHFIFKKSQENFSRITLRRLIQIKDGHPEAVQVWLAFLQKHAYYGIGMKANMWEFSSLNVGESMDKSAEEMKKLLKEKFDEHMVVWPEPKGVGEDLEDFFAKERLRASVVGTQRLGSLTRQFSSSPIPSEEPETPPSPSPPQVIFSGIQPTGTPHLGNYLGALRQWKTLQDTSPPATKLLFSIVDLHAITVPPSSASDLVRRKREMLTALLAIGLDPARSILFYQSSVPQHAEMQWILSCTASTGYLSRMTQWKSKLAAADVLVHRATHVPVGDDQRQHLEFARECVTNFHAAYGGTECLVYPETLLGKGSRRVMSLRNPRSKMSKSDPADRSRIALTDGAEVVRRKVNGAVTDSVEGGVSFDPEGRPGVANLLELLAAFGGVKYGEEVTAERLGNEILKCMAIKELKGLVAEAINAELDVVRDRYAMIEKLGDGYLEDVAEQGRKEAAESAEATMKLVRAAVGLV
ncbi:hypothetical protein QBC47DRAFT_298779 [Echria macrotheca]|uniref:Small ribosomal subunit protein uS10m n=1 Tax=Echria macrotheca TaxID=438768 RepID=A0AAJ0BDE3_9PEZI|nr:hypothetical protein QBC47DRAFT_298779 [Echria macrotheca]